MNSFITGFFLLFALHLSAQDCFTFTVDSLVTTPPLECGLEDGLISVFATSDNALAYSADGGLSFQNFSVFNGLFPGVYDIVVRDNDTGCEAPAGTAVISDPDGPEFVGIDITQPTCPDGTANGALSIDAIGADVEYSIDGGNFYFFDGEFDNLAPGSYEVVARHGDDCISYFAGNPVVLDAPDCSGGGTGDSLAVSIDAELPTCNGDTDGSLTAVATGGSPPYTYLWSTGATTAVLAPVAAGDYALTVTDADGAVVLLATTLPETAPILLTLSSTPIQNGDPGSATVLAADGAAPYNYVWSTGLTTATVVADTAGTYAVTVTDANGCAASGTVEVVEADCGDIAVDIDEVNPSCAGDTDGSVTALPSGGTAPYTYLWTTGDTTQTVDSLGAANYRVTITDAVGCTATVATALVDPFPIQFNTSVVPVSCNGLSDGSVSVQLVLGINTDILWSTGDTTATVSDLPAGDYGLTITNGGGCSAVTDLTVSEPAVLEVAVQTTAATDQGGGSAVALPTGGTPPYTYDWSNGASDSLITDLPVGFYTLNLTDANGCPVFTTFTITAAACDLAVTLDLTPDGCAGSGVGEATVSVTGAQGPFTVRYSTGDSTLTAAGLSAGSYSVQVVDSAFCSVDLDFEITQVGTFTAVPTIVGESCAGADGSISVAISGGTAPFTLTFDGAAAADTSFTELTAGDYPLIITDAEGCTVSLSLTVPDACDPTGCIDFIASESETLVVIDCDTTAAFCLDLPFFDLDEYTLTDNGAPYNGPTSGCDFDTTFVYAYGILPGDGPFEVQRWTANDSTFSGSIPDIFAILDSLAVWDPAGNWRADTAQQLITGGVSTSDYGNLELVQTASDTVIILQPGVLRTANGTNLSFGAGSHNLVITDTATGCADSLTVTVLCADDPGAVLIVPVFLEPGAVDTICLTELGYAPDTLTVIAGGCGPGDPAVATVELEEECFVVSGQSLGSTSECYLLCGATSCDTLVLEVTILAPGGTDGPRAVPDAQTTGQGMPIVVDVLQNDSIAGGITTFEITLDPLNGEAAILPDQSINYVPDPDFCGVDSFRYTVCTLEGCASTFVTVTVLCSELTIFDGFSPNGDGVNDAFTIRGLNSFDGHTLYVYNRWGNLVLESADYQNDWQGTWEGDDLPPGVYFYLLVLDGEDEPRTGALTLHR